MWIFVLSARNLHIKGKMYVPVNYIDHANFILIFTLYIYFEETAFMAYNELEWTSSSEMSLSWWIKYWLSIIYMETYIDITKRFF